MEIERDTEPEREQSQDLEEERHSARKMIQPRRDSPAENSDWRLENGIQKGGKDLRRRKREGE